MLHVSSLERRCSTGSVIGVLTIYNAQRCPFCARVRIALAEKGITYETVEIDLAQRPDWLYEKNRLGKVPVLEAGGWTLSESEIINEYLEEAYPEPPLLPADPAVRAAARVLVFRHDAFSRAFYDLRRGEDGAEKAFAAELAVLEDVLALTPYLTGASFGLADVAYIPWLLRARAQIGMTFERFSAIRGWLDRLAERPSIAVEIEIVAGLS